MKKSADPKLLKHKRRLCQVEGCPRIVKSQGRCQRHGAKPKSCKIANCPKQAQGNFDGMCSKYFFGCGVDPRAPNFNFGHFEKQNENPLFFSS
jgi:hypothetical protein